MTFKPLRIKATNIALLQKGGGEVCGEAEFSDAEALALAQLLKRITWTDMRSNAVDDVEAGSMRDAINKVQRVFADAGYNPR